MTLQQLEYILALEAHKHFLFAAEACGISQPTLSATISKLEDELDTKIFDRSSHPITPTDAGRKILDQARIILYNSAQLKELVLSEKQQATGEVKLGVIPTIAPYILPGLIKNIAENNPTVHLNITEASTSSIIPALGKAEMDMALMATPLNNPDLLEIPVYYEEFLAYLSPTHPQFGKKELRSEELTGEKLWILREEHCMSNQVLNLCHLTSHFSTIYRAGSIETLIRIVDLNGGYTVIPELHSKLLADSQKERLRPITDPVPVREISLVIRKDYVREKMLNIIAQNIRRLIPDHMVDSRLKKFAVRI